MHRLIQLSLLAGLLVSCHKRADTPAPGTSALKTEITGTPNAFRYPLGSGYRAFTGEFIGTPCVQAGPQGLRVVPSPEGSLRAGFSESRKAVEDRFSLDASAEATLGAFEVSGSAGVTLILAESKLKTTSYMTFAQRAGNVILLDPQVAPVGQGILQAATGANRELELYKGCGDEYVYQVELGSRLHLGIEYTFATEEIKNQIRAKLKISGPLGFPGIEIGDKLDGPSADKALGTIRLVAVQEGGDQAAFKAIQDGIPQTCSLKVEDKKLVREAFQACIDYYQNVMLDYAKNKFPQQVAKLESTHGDPNEISGLNVLRYYTRRYDQSGWKELQGKATIAKETATYVRKEVRPLSDRIFALQQLRRSFDNLVGTDVASSITSLDFDTWRRFRVEVDHVIDRSVLAFARCQQNIRDAVTGARAASFPECEAVRTDFDASLSLLRNDPGLPDKFKQHLNI